MLSWVVEAANPCAACAVRDRAICAGVPADRFERLASMVTHLTIAPEQALFFEGDPDAHAFSIVSGIARLSKALPDGRRLVTAFVHPGQFIGLASHQAYACTGEAVTTLKVCRFPKAGLEAFLRDNPEMERRVRAMTAAEIGVAQRQLTLLGRKSALERLASFLLTWSPEPLPSATSGRVVELPMSRADVADHLGLTRETVSRTFTSLVQDGIVEIREANTIILIRPDRLEDIADCA